jgi:CelD/BcsL family acetyltransferase involved in cellulose biosynthesis
MGESWNGNSGSVFTAERCGRDGPTAEVEREVRHRMVEMNALSGAEINRWVELRASNPALDSPYFHPGFAAAVAATRSGVGVIIGEDRLGAITSFLPVQLNKRACRPAGFPAVDFQGPVCAPGASYDVASAVAAAGASSYEFDHLLNGTEAFEPWIFGRQESPYLDVTGGLEGYLSRASRSGKDKVAEARRLSRKAEREYGPVRLTSDVADGALLDTVIALKRRQYAETGARDYFSDLRHVELLHRLLRTRDTDFGGLLSAIYAGPRLLAAHFGLRAGPVLHWWFPVYDPEFARLSPGWLLLTAVIDAAPELGVERIDLGRGMDDYKRRAMTGHKLVCQGAVIRGPVRRRTVLGRRRMLAAVKSSRIAPALRRVVRHSRRRSG